VAGRLAGTFVAGDATRSGIDITGTEGQAVYAAADGEVLFSGTGIIGYGELIVIQHPNGLLSAYGHSRRRLVNENAKIKRGQQIAEMGRDASGRQMLHFEVRKAGKPVDPLAYLPGR
jgi:lipoprotein NlpD